ncbi:P-loop containing nucleoside triphosphate hydrolase protein [Blastocladiella britannica]|nr:P-loop containing nucleoside triphosphate hydrolase protein [Blastocladiella britannica]
MHARLLPTAVRARATTATTRRVVFLSAYRTFTAATGSDPPPPPPEKDNAKKPDPAALARAVLESMRARSEAVKKSTPTPNSAPFVGLPRINLEPTRTGPKNKAPGTGPRNLSFSEFFIYWRDAEAIVRKAGEFGLNFKATTTVLRDFRAHVLKHKVLPTAEGFSPDDIPLATSILSAAWVEFLANYVPAGQRDTFNGLCETADLRNPHAWYPAARLMKREIIMHVGPTNSGKTHEALAALEAADSGIYCGPLRLLAHEIQERFAANGTPCNLVTGEERREMPFARVTSCTVEMADLDREVDVAVIDEIQVIGDSQRGWAWTQAVLGLRARTIYVCGEATAVPVMEQLCKATGDTLTVRKFTRLRPLEVAKAPVAGRHRGVEPGDCVVAFSRRDVFRLKSEIEVADPNVKCAVVYGALPPETRAQQARLFNDPESGYDVLVATDAVGMGLNLAIHRVIFSTVTKYDGKSTSPLSVSLLKQIGGRAGRFGKAHIDTPGVVSAFYHRDLKFVKETMALTPPDIASAGLQPSSEMIEAFALQLPAEPLSGLLAKFGALARVNSEQYFLCNFDTLQDLAKAIEDMKNMTIGEQYQFSLAPVNPNKPEALDCFKKIAWHYNKGVPFSMFDMLKDEELGFASTLDTSIQKEFKAGKQRHLRYETLMARRYAWMHATMPDLVAAAASDPSSAAAADSSSSPSDRVQLDLASSVGPDARHMHMSDAEAEEMVAAQLEARALLHQHAAAAVPLFRPVRSEEQLAKLETVHRAINTYLWLQQRFIGHPTFVQTSPDACAMVARECETTINDGLRALSGSRRPKGRPPRVVIKDISNPIPRPGTLLASAPLVA